MLTRFTKDTHHLKSAHKPVTLRPVLGRHIHYLWHLGGPPYFVLLDCIWHSNQPKGYVIYIHCHFSLPVSPSQTWPRSLCTLYFDSLSMLSEEVLAVNRKRSSILPFVPPEEKKKKKKGAMSSLYMTCITDACHTRRPDCM